MQRSKIRAMVFFDIGIVCLSLAGWFAFMEGRMTSGGQTMTVHRGTKVAWEGPGDPSLFAFPMEGEGWIDTSGSPPLGVIWQDGRPPPRHKIWRNGRWVIVGP